MDDGTIGSVIGIAAMLFMFHYIFVSRPEDGKPSASSGPRPGGGGGGIPPGPGPRQPEQSRPPGSGGAPGGGMSEMRPSGPPPAPSQPRPSQPGGPPSPRPQASGVDHGLGAILATAGGVGMALVSAVASVFKRATQRKTLAATAPAVQEPVDNRRQIGARPIPPVGPRGGE